MLYSLDSNHVTALPLENAIAPTDEQLMEQIQHRDEKALECLQKRHANLLRGIISGVLHCDSEVDDVFQDCFIQIWQNADHYSAEKGRALGWIATLVRRRSIDRMRRRSSYQCAQIRLREESLTFSDHCVGSDEEAAQNDRAQVVARLIERLPAAQQEVLRLAFYQGMSQRQIAAQTKIPLGTIKTRLELAMRKVRSYVLAFGGLHEDTVSDKAAAFQTAA